jgi:c-di-GMP-related signal transduction protein
MIDFPVGFNADDEYVYTDRDGFLFSSQHLNEEETEEIVKRVNLHDELVEALKDLSEIIGEMEECDAERINKSYRWICEIWHNAQNVLEKLK